MTIETAIEISVEVSDTMNYDIKVPRAITAETFPGVMKKLKALRELIPDRPREYKRGGVNPLYKLPLEESKDVLEKYVRMSKEDFSSFLESKYGLARRGWKNIVAIMGRLRKLTNKREEDKTQ